MIELERSFLFSARYRLARHLLFWFVHVLVFSFLFRTPDQSVAHLLILSSLWVPAFILYAYPVMYWMVPGFLLREKYLAFAALLLLWGVGGYFLNYIFRLHVLFPVSDLFHYKSGTKNPWAANSYLSMNVMAGFGSMIILFKHWIKKQKDFLTAENEKTNAELQLLKSQIHPHFLFNTLNNIYSLVNEKSEKAPGMLLRLSGLLNYVLYECKGNKVSLHKEILVMQDYIALEQERYGDRLEVSFSVHGDTSGYQVIPLLFQPFIENAFKHGTAEQLGKVWMNIEFSLKNGTLFFGVINSYQPALKTEEQNGIGIANVSKRLALLYPGRATLSYGVEADVYAVSLNIELSHISDREAVPLSQKQFLYEDPLLAGR